MQVSRRHFVQQVATGIVGSKVAAGPLTSLTLAGEPKPLANSLPIIDTHQHLWDLTKFNLPWTKDVPALNRSYVTSDYLKAIAGTNIKQAVYMEVDVDPKQQTAEAEHVLNLARDPKNVTVAGVISGRPASPEFKAYITRFKDVDGIKGVRQVLHGPNTKTGFCLQDSFVAGVRLLGELNKSFDVCIRPNELADAVKLAARCPDTRLIIDHCGNADPKLFGKSKSTEKEAPSHDPDDWRRQMSALARKPNTICKISGIVARARKGSWSAADLAPVINHCLDEFGPDRVIFGSDWPVCTLVASVGEWVTALHEIISTRPAADQKKLLAENARKLYRLGT